MKYWFLLLLTLAAALTLPAQDNTAEKKRVAKEYMLHQKFREALINLNSSRALRVEDEEGRFLIAVCQYHLNRLDESEAILKELTRDDRPSFPEAWLFMGRIYHARHQFAEAARYYKDYLRSISEMHPNRQMVVDEVLRCSNGIQYQYRAGQVFVENLGAGTNTEYDEWGPLQSPNFSDRLYFSSSRRGTMGGPRDATGRPDERLGQYRSDIFFCQNINGRWSEVQPMHYLLNSPQNEVLLGFSPNGQVLYYYKGVNMTNGIVMVDTFQQERTLKSDPFSGPLTAMGDRAAPHFVDGATVIFPSRRSGGYGGLDLYLIRRVGGRWTAPQNLGPMINSAYDETTPFLARDGKTLFFSSNDSEKSIGGFDVFRSEFVAQSGRWTRPANLGIPINSAADDTHFRLANDGFSAFFSSSRKDGMGGLDLYVAYFDDFLSEQEPPGFGDQTFLQSAVSSPEAPPAPSLTPAPTPAAGTPPPTSNQYEAPRTTTDNLVNLPALHFDNRRAIFASDNLRAVDQLAEILKKYPGLKVAFRIFARTGPQGVADQLYEALDNGQAVINYLKNRGAPTEAITLMAMALPSGSSANNFALDFIIPEHEGLPEKVDIQRLNGAPVKASAFRIQIAVLGGSFGGNMMDDWPDPMVSKEPGRNVYHYFVGNFESDDETKKVLLSVKESGFMAAKVLPFSNGWAID